MIPLDTYVKGKIKEQEDILNITSQEKTVIDGEVAVKLYGFGTGDYSDKKCITYLVMHDSEPY